MSADKTKVKTGLGRGFDTLIPQGLDRNLFVDEHERVEKVLLDNLQPARHNPRTTFDETSLSELASSIKRFGILQPLIATSDGAGKYTIIAGERRWRAARLAGLDKVPVVVRTTKEMERLEIALIENVQRVDLSALEQAASIERLHQQFSMSYETIAERMGKGFSTVVNIVRLLQLPQSVKDALEKDKITMGHARTILSLKNMPEKQEELLKNILKHGWTVRQTEQFVTSVHEGYKESRSTRERMRTETPATKKISRKLDGAPVQIYRMARGGKLEIAFKGDDQLEFILQKLG